MTFRYPTNYIAITQYYSISHKALDLGWNSNYGGPNMPIYASNSGTVIEVVKNYNKTDTEKRNYGNYVKIKHEEGYVSLYAHLKYESITLNVNDTVKTGDQIGLMGNTGYSNGNHLHFEIYKDGNKINPLEITYVYPNQTISKNEVATKGLLFYKKESTPDNIEEIQKLNNEIEELKKINNALKEQNENLTNEIKSLTNYRFTYIPSKTSYYKIKLYENEILIIKDN